MVAEEEVVVCVVSSVVVVAGDGMGLLGESGASSRLARWLARSLFCLTPKRRSPARDEMVGSPVSSLLNSARRPVSILIVRAQGSDVCEYCSVRGVLVFFTGTESVFLVVTAVECWFKVSKEAKPLSQHSRWRAAKSSFLPLL